MKYGLVYFIYNSTIKLYLFFLSFFKVKKNRILLHQPFKFGYDCNPRYIAEELIKRKIFDEIIWVTRSTRAENAKYPPEIKVVSESDVFKLLYYFSTSFICISNSYFGVEKFNFKKKKQIFIDTWHGALGIKKIGMAEHKNLQDQESSKEIIKQKIGLVDIFISNSDFETDVYKKALLFDKKIYKFGHPRNDVFFENSSYYIDKLKAKENIKEFLKNKFDENKKIVLYAPTFRHTACNDCYDLDYNLLLALLEEKFNEKFILALKFHPTTHFISRSIVKESDRIFDFTCYTDMQGLMAVSDIMLTDYSSCIFDFMLQRKPAFVYASDIDEYNTERGFFYPLETTPFPIIKNNNELKNKILNFNEQEYKNNVEQFLREKGCLEDGYASERVVDLIESLLGKKLSEELSEIV